MTHHESRLQILCFCPYFLEKIIKKLLTFFCGHFHLCTAPCLLYHKSIRDTAPCTDENANLTGEYYNKQLI